MDLLQQLQDWFNRHLNQGAMLTVYQDRVQNDLLIYTAILRTEWEVRVRVGTDARQALSRLMSNPDNLTAVATQKQGKDD